MMEPLRVCPSIHLNWVDDSKVVSTVMHVHYSPSLSAEDIFEVIKKAFPKFDCDHNIVKYHDDDDLIELSNSDHVNFRFDIRFSQVCLYIFCPKQDATNFVPPTNSSGPAQKFGGRLPGISPAAVSRATKEVLDALNLRLEPLGELLFPLVTTTVRRLLLRKTEESSLAVHTWITCDGCKDNNFSSTRYKCLECSDYDLCAPCYRNNKHRSHVMLRVPISFVQQEKSQYLDVVKRVSAAASSAIPVFVD